MYPYKQPREKTPPNQLSKNIFPNLFQKPKDNPKPTSLFPTTTVNTGVNPFTQPQQSTTPQKTGLFPANPQPTLFPTTTTSTAQIFRPTTPPNMSATSIFPNGKPTGVSPFQVQAEVAELIQVKKDNQLQKQMMEQMLIRIKELETKNVELQKQKTELLQRNILLENTIKTYQQQTSLTFPTQPQLPAQQYQYTPTTQPISMQPTIPQIQPIKSNPIHFDYSKKNQLFTEKFPPSLFKEDDMMPSAWTEKTFVTPDGYAFQAFVAFNSFYVVKYIILQKVKNQKGYVDLTECAGDALMQQNKQRRALNWHLYHQNSARNVIPQSCIEQLTQTVIKQMKSNDSTPISINITFQKYLSITDSKCVIYHPDWTIANPFELQLYNFYNYNTFNQETKNIMKKNIHEWIQEKHKEHKEKKSVHQLLMWFDDASGVFHLIWK